MKKIYSLTILLFFVVAAWSQTRSWNGGSGNWNDATKWTPAGVPVISDVLEFNGISATISNAPNLAFKGIIVTGSNIVLNAAGRESKLLSIGYKNSDTAIVINADASLTIGNNLNIALAKNALAVIEGTLIVTTDRHYYTNEGATTKTIVRGTIRNNGGAILSEASMLEFKNDAVYEHARDKGAIPVATWSKNSNCNIQGIVSSAPDGLNQIFGNYKWDCEHQKGGALLGNAIPSDIRGALVIDKTGTGTDPAVYLQFPRVVKIDGAFILNAGTCTVKRSKTTIDLAGDFIMRGGSLYTNAAPGNAEININLKGTAKQLFSKTGGTIRITGFTILDNAIVDLGESVLDGDANFTVAAGGKLMTAHPAGIALTGATGAIQVKGTRTFSSNADYGYTGSVSQITGTGLPGKVRRLIIDNNTGLLQGAGVMLSKATTVSGQLVLTNGFLQTTDENILTIADGGETVVADNSFVAGPMRKTGKTSFTFPTGWAGAGGGRIPIGIGSISTAATIQAEYKRAPATNKGSTINAPLHHISYCEYWELFPTSGKSTAIITMYRNAHSNCNPVSYINDFSSARVARSNGIAWTQVGNANDSLNGGTEYVVSGNAGITISSNEKFFALGNVTTASDPLPVLFDNVLAYEKNEGVNIEWSNLTERDIAIYYVERSVNGMDYTMIGQYLPTSNRDDKASYTGFDANPMPGANYYRIKAIIKSTKIIFSKVMRIETGKPRQKLSLFPNPVINKQLILAFAGLGKGNFNLRVTNLMGQDIYQSVIINKGSFARQAVKLPSSVKPGIYNLIITGINYQENKMFIVQ